MSYHQPNTPKVNYDREFGNLVREIRLKKGLLQRQVIERASERGFGKQLTLKQLQKIEQGQCKIACREAHILALSAALDLEASLLPVFYMSAGLGIPVSNDLQYREVARQIIDDSPNSTLSLPNMLSTDSVIWSISQLSHLSQEQEQIIERGIEAFELVVDKDKSMPEVLDHLKLELDDVRAAIKCALYSSSLEVTHVARDQELEDLLSQLWPRLKAIVAKVPPFDSELIRSEFVAFLAANFAFSQLQNESVVGLGGGHTLIRLAELTQPNPNRFRGTQWLPLMSSFSKNLNHISANQVVNVLARRHPDTTALYFPNLNLNPSEFGESSFQEIDEASNNMKAAFISATYVGRMNSHPTRLFTADGQTEPKWDTSTLLGKENNQFAGQVLGIFLDSKGNPLGLSSDAQDTKLGYSFETNPTRAKNTLQKLRQTMELRHGRVWIVAACRYKAKAVFTALESGLCNALVIDRELGQQLIDWKMNRAKNLPLPSFEDI